MNQTTMAALSMVLIVAIIGGSNVIRWEVLSAIRWAELGRSLMAGGVIVNIAILLDGITPGKATLRPPKEGGTLGALTALAALAALLSVYDQSLCRSFITRLP